MFSYFPPGSANTHKKDTKCRTFNYCKKDQSKWSTHESYLKKTNCSKKNCLLLKKKIVKVCNQLY